MSSYLDWIREQSCCLCFSPFTEAHHVIGYGAGKMGGKAPDIAAVPLCRICHQELHNTFSDEWIRPQLKWLIETLDKAVKDGRITI